jgi:hypothetical protein
VNKHQVSPEVISKLRETLLEQSNGHGRFWKEAQDKIRQLSDDDLISEATEELRRLHALYYD